MCGNWIDVPFNDTEVICRQQISVRACLAVVTEWFDLSEDVKDSRGRRRSIVEKTIERLARQNPLGR